jgi:thioredoxin reductase (NADPH)
MSEQSHYDVIILGTGPAGIQAAIHAARKKISVAMLGRQSKSSLVHAHVENYYGVFNLEGEEMLRAGQKQAEQFGAQTLEEDALAIRPHDDKFTVKTEGGRSLTTYAVIIATGTARNRLGVPGEKEFLGRGVSYCVECDGNFFRGEDVAVIGSESAAVDGALTLQPSARQVHLISDRINVTEALMTALRNSPVTVHEGLNVTAIEGETAVDQITLSNGHRLAVSGVFIELGAKGVMGLATSLGIQLDVSMKYIAADKQQATNVPGIYAAGDVCGPPWQVAKAVGEGCVAGIEAAGLARKKARAAAASS